MFISEEKKIMGLRMTNDTIYILNHSAFTDDKGRMWPQTIKKSQSKRLTVKALFNQVKYFHEKRKVSRLQS